MTDEEKLKSGRGEFNYKGNLCRQIIGGWIIHNTVCKSFEEVEDVLMDIGSILSESIVSGRSVTVSCGNGFNISVNAPDAEINQDFPEKAQSLES